MAKLLILRGKKLGILGNQVGEAWVLADAVGSQNFKTHKSWALLN
jgi:hypothetical protein